MTVTWEDEQGLVGREKTGVVGRMEVRNVQESMFRNELVAQCGWSVVMLGLVVGVKAGKVD